MKIAVIDIQDIFDGSTNTRVQAIHSYIAKRSLDIDKLREFATNGASIMVGCPTGVATQLKQCSPSIISIHRVNHKLTLAASHAANNILQTFSVSKHTSEISFTVIIIALYKCLDCMLTKHC